MADCFTNRGRREGRSPGPCGADAHAQKSVNAMALVAAPGAALRESFIDITTCGVVTCLAPRRRS
jgi:hypothetical protein